MQDRISILTITYNAEEFLEETIQSVINQDYPNIEFVIIDGLSTDRTKAIVDRYREYIDVFISEPDDGIYDAINKGIAQCSGNVIKIQNADDLLLPGAVTVAMRELENYDKNEPVILIGHSRVIDKYGKKLGLITQKATMLGFESFNHPGWFARKSVYKTCGAYSLNYRIASDYEYYLRYKSGGGKIVWINHEVACYRQDGASSGFEGVREVAQINRTYFGLLHSLFVRIQHQSGKILRPLVRKLRTLTSRQAREQP
jgi:glycosyltransferase involved in cell wall biosynthesis